MTVRIRGNTRVRSQTLVGFPPQPALNLDFTKGYANGLNPLPSTVTFTRNDAGAYATQVGPDGLVRLAAHNIALYSQQFNDANWSKAAGTETVTADTTTAPDGTVTADTVQRSGTTFWHGVRETRNVLTNTIYTFSCYVKPNTGEPGIILAGGTVLDASVYVTSGGVVSVKSDVGTSRLVSYGGTSVGNGWWRLWMVFNTASLTTVGFGTADGSSVNNASNYFWGAQLEQNLTPSYYVPTTSAAKYADTPRFDYDPVTTEPRGLLIEEARTNLITYSEQFDQGVWIKTAGPSAVTPDVAVSPAGVASADLLYPTSSNAAQAGSVYRATTTGTVVSVYAKAAGFNYVCLWNVAGSTGAAWFNLGSGTLGTVVAGYTATITPAGNGWYRCSVRKDDGSVFTYIQIQATNADNTITPTASGTNGVYIWGAQFETGSFPTSYIPTVASSVTRAADVAAAAGAAQTLLAAASCTTISETSNIAPNNCAFFADGSFNIYTSNSNALLNNTQVAAKNITPFSLPSGSFVNIQRVALAWSAAGSSLAASGSTVATGAAYSTPGQMYFGSNGAAAGTTYFINGYMRRFTIYDYRMPDAKLQLISKV